MKTRGLLKSACDNLNITISKLISEDIAVSATLLKNDKYGKLVLMCKNHQENEIISYISQNKINQNVYSSLNCPILLHALVNQLDCDVIKCIIDNGADINWENSITSIFTYAILNNTSEIVKLCISHNAEVYYVTNAKLTPTIIAWVRDDATIKTLIEMAMFNEPRNRDSLYAKKLNWKRGVLFNVCLEYDNQNKLICIERQNEIIQGPRESNVVCDTPLLGAGGTNNNQTSVGLSNDISHNGNIPVVSNPESSRSSVLATAYKTLHEHAKRRNEKYIPNGVTCPLCRKPNKFIQKVFHKTECLICLEETDIVYRFICGHLVSCEKCSEKL